MTIVRLPAYGKHLLLARRAGRHPSVVTLVYGDRWREAVEPKICLKPDDYAPGQFDFSMVAGCRVLVLDQAMGEAECAENARPPTFGKFFDLLREVAAADAYVWLTSPLRSLIGVALSSRWFDCGTQRMQWPRWWDDNLDEVYCARESKWLDYSARLRGNH